MVSIDRTRAAESIDTNFVEIGQIFFDFDQKVPKTNHKSAIFKKSNPEISHYFLPVDRAN